VPQRVKLYRRLWNWCDAEGLFWLRRSLLGGGPRAVDPVVVPGAVANDGAATLVTKGATYPERVVGAVRALQDKGAIGVQRAALPPDPQHAAFKGDGKVEIRSLRKVILP
jgi:hypothetical protein